MATTTAALDASALARTLFDGFEHATVCDPPSELHEGLTIGQAYAVQRALVELHLAAGRRIAGRKVGLTSADLQRQAGIDQPDYGVLFDTHVFSTGVRLSRGGNGMIQPRLEAELAFVLERPLAGPGVTSVQVLAATRGIVPVFEIVDSRVRDWRLEIVDTIADNASGWGTVLGDSLVSPLGIDLGTIGMVLERDGEVVLTGAGAWVLGNPARAIAWLANKLAEYGEQLPAGQPVLSGSFTRVVDGDPGRYVARFGDGIGSVELTITD